MIKTKLVLTWFDIILSLEHSGAWPHGALLISSILRAVIFFIFKFNFGVCFVKGLVTATRYML